MGHYLTGLIAKPDVLAMFSDRHGLPAPVALPQQLALIALDSEDLDRIFPAGGSSGEYPEGFTFLDQNLVDELATVSRDASVMYFETDYHGGVGVQAAIVLTNAKTAFGPSSGDIGPINQALAVLGVEVAPTEVDEFDSLGLGYFRDIETWRYAASGQFDAIGLDYFRDDPIWEMCPQPGH